MHRQPDGSPWPRPPLPGYTVADLVVIPRNAACPAGRDQYSAADVVLAIEVVSPDSESRDRSTKPLKYATAGIPHFWLVERDPRTKRPVVHTHIRSATGRGYEPTGVHRDRLKVDEPFTIDIDLGEYDRL
ncbi:Uma2 family endonuclease [Streptomyces tsukubensis]|uniref:Uma2 family endonuclease n=1 Tax=Streptomyces tsukubensis TaxID=83656 RepID=UPI0034504A1C